MLLLRVLRLLWLLVVRLLVVLLLLLLLLLLVCGRIHEFRRVAMEHNVELLEREPAMPDADRIAAELPEHGPELLGSLCQLLVLGVRHVGKVAAARLVKWRQDLTRLLAQDAQRAIGLSELQQKRVQLA